MLRHPGSFPLGPLTVLILVAATACGGGGSVDETNLEDPAMVLVDEGQAQLEAGDAEGALATFDDAIATLGAADGSLIYARAQVGRGAALVDASRLDEAVATFDAVVDGIGLTDNSDRAALAINTIGRRLNVIEDPAEWLSAYESYRERFNDYRSLDAPNVTANAFALQNAYALRLELVGRYDEALAVYDSIAEQHEDTTDSDIQLQVGAALTYAAANLQVLNRNEEALFFYQRAIEVATGTSDEELALLGSEAWLDMAQLLTSLNATVEALEAYATQLELYGAREDINHRRLNLRGLLESGLLLQDLNRIDEAQAAYQEVLRQVEVPSSDATLAALAGVAEHQLGIILRG